MFRRIFSVFLDSHTESLKLQDSYRRLTTRLGWPSPRVAWVGLTILFVPIAFYAGMLAIYGAWGLLLSAIGRLSWRQALDFALRARYPRQWYRPNA